MARTTVVSGPRGSGKSTLARALAACIGVPVLLLLTVSTPGQRPSAKT
ncbi:ATP-binding protein [Nocardia carnea]|nr:AAA family ATPase [Nocardia carnea]